MHRRILVYAYEVPTKRVTFTVDEDLIEFVQIAVAEGRAESVSSWIAAAIADRSEKELKLYRLRVAIADFETEFGEITEDEMRDRQRLDRDAAAAVRANRPEPA